MLKPFRTLREWLVSRFVTSNRRRSGRGRPAVQGLEDRLVPSATPDLLHVPIHFEVNRGQAAPGIDYLARGDAYSLALDQTRVSLALDSSVVDLYLVNANPDAPVRGVDPQQATANYFAGDEIRWIAGVETFARVRYGGLWDGIDAIYYGTNQRQLEYDFLVAPFADHGQIRLRFDGIAGLSLDTTGNLVLRLPDGGEVVQKAPVLYQDLAGGRVGVEGGYELFADETVGFRVGAYDASRELVIDPIVAYGSYMPHTSGIVDVAIANTGEVYVLGDGGIPGQVNSRFGSGVYVARFNADLSQLLGTAYLGDQVTGLAGLVVDADSRVWVAGTTRSHDDPLVPGYDGFPLKNAWLTNLAGGSPKFSPDGFVTRFAPGLYFERTAHYPVPKRD